jgi:hypothetical protein
MSYGLFRVAMDAPTYLDNATLVQAVAALISNGMSHLGYDTASFVTVQGMDATMNLAQPMVDGFALCDFTAYMYVEPALTNTQLETTLANDIVQQLWALEGHPANVAVSYIPNNLVTTLPVITPIGSAQYLVPLNIPSQVTALPPIGLNQNITSFM